MAKLRIKIEADQNGYVCIADNGDLPFEGRIHPTVDNAMSDLMSAYADTSIWQTKIISDIEIEIETD